MSMSMMISSLMIFMMGALSFVLKRKHLLLMLLSLEFMVISLYLNIMFLLCSYDYEFFFVMIFLTMSVCEGALGLSILVSMIRSHGNDYFTLFNLLW